MRWLISEFWDFVLDIPLILLSYVVPKDNDLYVFFSGEGDGVYGNSKYLYFYFKKRGKKVKYLCVSKLLEERLRRKGIDALHSFTSEGFKTKLKAKYIFVTHGIKGVSRSSIGMFLGNFNFIQTWHGVGFKPIELLDPNKKINDKLIKFIYRIKYKAVLSTSDAISEKFKRAFNTKNVFITGFPRNDILFNNDLLLEDYYKDLGLHEYDKVILYAPTFREIHYNYFFTEDFLTKLDEWLKEKNYVFLIKKHPYDNAVKTKLDYRMIWDVSNRVEDIHDLLPHVDVLISDYSSVVTDFALLRRPIILYIHDIDRYVRYCRNFYFDPRDIFPGPFAYTQEELFDLLRDLGWFNNPDYKSRYERFVDFFHKYKDGKSCERVEKLLKYLEGRNTLKK